MPSRRYKEILGRVGDAKAAALGSNRGDVRVYGTTTYSDLREQVPEVASHGEGDSRKGENTVRNTVGAEGLPMMLVRRLCALRKRAYQELCRLCGLRADT